MRLMPEQVIEVLEHIATKLDDECILGRSDIQALEQAKEAIKIVASQTRIKEWGYDWSKWKSQT